MGERAPCNLCGKSMRDKRELRRHVLTQHDKVKPWFCELCGFQSGRYGNLKIHRKITHKMEIGEQMNMNEFLKFIKDGKHPHCTQLDLDHENIAVLA